MTTPEKTLIGWFSNGKKPDETQFKAWIESYWHKEASIPIGNIDGIDDILTSKADKEALEVAFTSLLELINSIETGAVIDDTLEASEIKTYSITQIRKLINDIWATIDDLYSDLGKQSTLQGITTNGNSTDKDIITNYAVIGRDATNENLKFGKDALKSIPSEAIESEEIYGTKNTAIGDYALAANKKSPENVAVGYNVLKNLIGGDWNTVIGNDSGTNLIKAENVTIIGVGSMTSATSASRDVVIGSYVLVKYTGTTYKSISYPDITRTSGKNVVIGDTAMSKCIYGYGNVAIGSRAGVNFLNYGDGNIFIGMNITGSTPATNGDLNVVIGTNAPINGSGNGRLIIHSQFIKSEGGTGNASTIPLIEGHFIDRWLRIAGNLKLMYDYTPDVKDGFEATKMLVLDKDGNTGVKDLPEKVEDTGWIDIEYQNGIYNYETGYAPGQYRKIGNQIFIQGLVKGGETQTNGQNYILFSLPEGFRPKYRHYFITGMSGNNLNGRIDVKANGKVCGVVYNSAGTSLETSFFVD